MKVNPRTVKGGKLELRGKTYWFCSSSCRKTFLSQHPEAKP